MNRFIAILLIFFLLGATGLPLLPLSGISYFVYAEEKPENLTEQEVIDAGLTVYLNARNAYITSTGNSVDGVKAIMKSWINSVEFWRNTTVGSMTELYAGIIIKYSPFRVSLKGSAITAFNDLYDWLVDTGKIPNANNSSGGETTDNLYTGKMIGSNLIYFVNQSRSSTDGYLYNKSNLTAGTNVWLNGDSIKELWLTKYPNTNFSKNGSQNNAALGGEMPEGGNPYTFVYNANYTGGAFLRCSDITNSNSYLNSFCPRIQTGFITQINSVGKAQMNTLYCENGINSVRAEFGNMMFSGDNNTLYYGIISINYTSNKFTIWESGHTDLSNLNPISTNVNFDTNNFVKNNPTPPQDDEEDEYTPKDKTTGDTFNTYNQYITNYVEKNTIVNKTEVVEPETPGGTEPPWTDDNQGSAGTLTPDGQGGFDLSLPDLTLPDLDIDWSINGLKDKFPFSIPWDLMAFFTVLNAEPETPHFEGTIPLGIWEWEIDWDLHYFDNLAILVRNLEFIAFCIGLIIVTRNIIKG